MSSEKKRETNRKNAEHSTGPKSPRGKAHSSSNSMTHGRYAKDFVPRGDDREPFQRLERKLREDTQRAALEFYFRRLVRNQWHIQLTERAILRFTETSTHDSRPNTPQANNHEADLIALEADVDAARQRRLVARSQSSAATPKARAKKDKRRAEEIDRAVLEGLAQPGQGGQLSQLHEELRKLERDFDRNLKLFLALQRDSVTADRELSDGEAARDDE